MRKIKKINGFLVVKFNDREKREYEGTALGEYGVIDAEVYTGNLDIDRGAMEYDDADTLEVAVELARGLESEEDITDEPPTYTAAVETNESYTEEAVEPAALIEGWTRRLATQVKSKHYPDTDPRTAAHELYGFKMALRQIGFLPESEVITDPDTFGAGRLDGPMGILSLERVQILPQDGLSAHGVHQGDLHAGELDVCGHQVNALRVVQDTLAGAQRLVHQDTAHRVGQGKGQLVRLGVAQADGQAALRVPVDQQHFLSGLRQPNPQVRAGGCLANAAFLVGDGDDLRVQ